MNNGAKIGLFATLTAVGAGMYFSFLSKNKKGEIRTTFSSENKKLIKKVVGKEREDNFITLSNQHIQASINATKRFSKDELKEDLKIFGTEVGLIDVSNDENLAKEETKLYNNIAKIGSSIALKSIPKVLHSKRKVKKRTTPFAYQGYLQKEFSKTQVTIANSSTVETLIRLWGANSSATISPFASEEVSSKITINDSYYEKAQSFLHNPAIVKHIKWVLSGDARFKILQFVEETPTGLKKSTPISHENYKSPQNYSNVSEMTDLEGTIIDGKISWLFKIAGFQTITLIVYYRQFQFEQFIPQKIAI